MSNTIRLVQIINEMKCEGLFANRETPADNQDVVAKGATNTPGQFGAGCNIPDCTGGQWWDTHRMTVSLDDTTLSFWKEGDRVYYRSGQTVYPGEGTGHFIWSDNGLPVVLVIGTDATASMLNP